jgi:hypothetical protein
MVKFSKSVKSESLTWERTVAICNSSMTKRNCSTARAPPAREKNISSVSNDHIAKKTTTIPSIKSANIQIYGQSHDSNLNGRSHSLLSDKAFSEALLVIALFFALSFISCISIKYLTNASFIDAFLSQSLLLLIQGYLLE